jgi:BirA family biotin operon repressor/biotin-[acetyl-CoA-carboxylase] ligase
VHHVARTSSTQDVVRQAALTGAAEGFCCLADAQTAGRGRYGHAWIAAPGAALLASILVRRPTGNVARIPFAAGLAMFDAIGAMGAVPVALKWPNDLVTDGRKLAGILCEVEPAASTPERAAVAVGAGVNLAARGLPAELHAAALDEFGPPPSARSLLDAWAHALAARLRMLDEQGLGRLLEDWRPHDALCGEDVRCQAADGAVAGVAAGVDDTGALLVRTASGVVRVLAGDVVLTSPRG